MQQTFYSKTKFGSRVIELKSDYIEFTGKVRGSSVCERISLRDLECSYERVEIRSLVHIYLPLLCALIVVGFRRYLIRYGFPPAELVNATSVAVIAMLLWMSFSALRPTIAFRFKNKQRQLRFEIAAERRQLGKCKLFVEQISLAITKLQKDP